MWCLDFTFVCLFTRQCVSAKHGVERDFVYCVTQVTLRFDDVIQLFYVKKLVSKSLSLLTLFVIIKLH